MIDQNAVAEAYEQDRFYALQLEINDACMQGCAYCYMNALPHGQRILSDYEVLEIVEQAAGAGFTVIEWLGGEPLDRPGAFAFMERAHELGLRNNLWTGGLPLDRGGVAERVVELSSGGLVSVHLSTLDPAVYVLLHPERTAQDMSIVLSGVERLLALGYPAERMLNSVTLTGAQGAEDMIATIDAFEDRYGIRTSLNIYHTYLRPGHDPGELEWFVPSAGDVTRVQKRLQRQWGGPMPMNCVDKRYCSTTVAVLNDGTVTPCATIRDGVGSIREQEGFLGLLREQRDSLVLKTLKDPANLPDGCVDCGMSSDCWGCRSRAYAIGAGVLGKDPRCRRSGC
ncbi:MAG: radical SAM protein [Coriobacteriia bacterium]|nr:radical SAM protein [Coriobacteriia bacterium]